MTRPVDHARRADQESRVLAARARLEAAEKHPSALAISRVLGWSSIATEVVVARLRDQGRWPESPIPPTKPGPPKGVPDPGAAGKAREKGRVEAPVMLGGPATEDEQVEAAIEAINGGWSESERRRRMRRAGSGGRPVGIRVCRVSLHGRGY